MKLKTKLLIIGLLVLVVTLFNVVKSVYTGSTNLYNNHVTLEQNYQQVGEDQVATYQANYLSFQQQFDVASINKEAFVVVTDIIMSNRHDGQQLAWKWVSENQQIPYSEFTDFYKQLTAFTQSQYNEYLQLERRKQSIVNQHNQNIRLFPNNIYNWWLKIKPLHYKQGFVTDSTRKLFNYRE